MKSTFLATAAAGMLTATAAAGTTGTVITFDNGWEGWNGTGSQIVPTGGNPGANVHTQFTNFGTEYWTATNDIFLGDYTQYESVTLSMDVKVNEINFYGTPVSRKLILDLRSFSHGQNGYPWASVWYDLGTLQGGMDWTTFSITFDPNASEMPDGWGGTGAEDPDTYMPKLPDNLTFGDIVSSIEQVNFSTYEPGYMYSVNTYFDLHIDNIRIELTPKTTPGDLNGDGSVGVADLLILINSWGRCSDCGTCPADLTGDCTVGVSDLLILIGNWG